LGRVAFARRFDEHPRMRADSRASCVALLLVSPSVCAACAPVVPARRVIVVDDTIETSTLESNCARLCAEVARPGESASCGYGRLDQNVDLGNAIGYHLGVVCILTHASGATR
jgi:hypothetical protein